MFNFKPLKQIIEKIINRINEDPVKISGIFAGSGSSFANWFLTTPGSSNTLMQLDFPYSHGSVDELLGRVPGVYVTEQVANEFANIAYLRASRLVSVGEEVIGIGCTSALISDVPKKGEHRAYVSIRNKDEMLSVSLKLNKGFRDRISEEDLVSRFILNEVDEFWFKSGNDILLSDLSAEDEVCRKENKYYEAIKQLFETKQPFLIINQYGELLDFPYYPTSIIPGSFNPLHTGHKQLAKLIGEMKGSTVDFEISIYNVDKDNMTMEDVNQRILQFIGVGTIIISKSKTFVEKSAYFKGCSFVVGWDTAVRILDAKYYDNNFKSGLAALDSIRKNRCEFIVVGRLDEFGNFRNAKDISIPDGYEDMFIMIEEEKFRSDISSTDFRIQN